MKINPSNLWGVLERNYNPLVRTDVKESLRATRTPPMRAALASAEEGNVDDTVAALKVAFEERANAADGKGIPMPIVRAATRMVHTALTREADECRRSVIANIEGHNTQWIEKMAALGIRDTKEAQLLEQPDSPSKER